MPKIQYIDEPTPLIVKNGEKINKKISVLNITLQQAPYASFDAENSLSSPEPVVEKLIKPVFVERVDRVHFKNFDSVGVLGSVRNLRHDILDTVKSEKFGSTKTLDPKDYFARNRHCPIASLSRNTTYDGFPIFALGERGSGLKSRGEVQDFRTIRDECLANGTLFEDPDFQPINESLMFSRRPDRHIEWLRPQEISDDPQFFVEGWSRFDVQQGELGDCWFLAATANLTMEAKLFVRVVPDDQSFQDRYCGIFHFVFWQYGRWIDVVIDDRLPTYRGKLLYMSSGEANEFWSALLEKAYAKLHGSYEALKGGTTCEAMEDFTGGVAEMYELKEAPPNLFSILIKAVERNSMIACSIEPDPNVTEAETPEGLIRGHAYSITKVELMDIITPNTQGKIQMLRLRNPWGNDAEWNGPWSDSSPEWRFIPEQIKQDIGLTFDHDGEFWMSYRDFLQYFDRVEICNLSPDSLSDEQVSRGKKKWEMSYFEGEWTEGVTAGGCRNFLDSFWHNPQYTMDLEDPDEDDDEGLCTVIVALMQKNRRSRKNAGMECLTIGFAIYALTDRDLQQKPQPKRFFQYNASVARSPAFINLREVSCRFKLPPGSYLIVPSTFEPGEEGEFLIRIFSECRNHMQENDDDVGLGQVDDRVNGLPNDIRGSVLPMMPEMNPTDNEKDALETSFIEIGGKDGEVDWMELKTILDRSMRDFFPLSVTQSNGHNVESTYPQQESGPPENDPVALLCGCLAGLLNNAQGQGQGGRMDDDDGGGRVPLQQQIITTSASATIDQQGFSKDVCRSMVAMLDVDQSGRLGFDEFKSLMTDVRKWKEVFKLYDVDGSGKLSPFELREALNSAGYHLNNRVLNALAHRYGSRDGSIAFDDFIMCAIKMKTMIEIFKERDIEGTNMATFSMEEWVEKTVYS